MSDPSRRGAGAATVYEIINLKVFTALIEALPSDRERITLVCNNITGSFDTSTLVLTSSKVKVKIYYLKLDRFTITFRRPVILSAVRKKMPQSRKEQANETAALKSSFFC